MNIPAISSIVFLWVLMAFISGCIVMQEESTVTPGYIVSEIQSAPQVDVSEGITLYRLINPAYTDTKGNDIVYDLSYIQAIPGAETGYHMLKSTSEGFFIVSGNAEISANGTIVLAKKGDFVLVPADTLMNVKNTGGDDLLMYSICEPYYRPETEMLFKIASESDAFSDKPVLFVKNIDDIKPDYYRNMFYFTQIITPDETEDTIYNVQYSYDLGYVVIPPGECSTVHRLTVSGEAVAILSGSGKVNIDREIIRLSEGMVVYIPVNSVQAIINDGNKDLIYLSIVNPAWTIENDILINTDCSILITE